MFHTPVTQITFEQVEHFCRTFEEGVRVEYKQAPAHIAKIISSFANTAGGIWVIGVETDGVTNRPSFPINGMAREPGVQERIIQSAQTGIYPAVTPDVQVLDVPGLPDRIIVVVKVPESVEAPHAIENSTRVYLRVASTTLPYELADIDRIEYLLRRRQEPERRREELIAQAAARSPYQGTEPRLRVIVAPIYPRGLIVPLEALYERARAIDTLSGYFLLREFRRVHAGIMSSNHVSPRVGHHFEIDARGIVLFERPIEVEGEIEGLQTRQRIPYVRPINLLYHVALVLDHAFPLFQGTITNILIRYELFGWRGIGLVPEFRDRSLNRDLAVEQHRCIDPHIAASTHTIMETLPGRRVEVLTEIMRQVLWAFDYTNPDLHSLLGQALRDNRLL